ncbi:HAD family hydrolase [Maribacter aurantiacus]|uniref:phosphoglycolate phosphatase n=1 Tax=Maribacter aurantiacus TaxID=1882343 RepID=A0A5R8MCH1_9FLAO|nr:HAD hydrolase-like protein [Maribacter aurantiacus]TLF46479.1 hypothetical protein FEK29_01495 [Maribacter aurantiacus]
MALKNIFFDFDGVLAESVGAKTEAFKEMYLPHGEDIANMVVDYHIHHGGISRFEKFKYWEKTFFGKELSEEDVHKMAQKFSSLVLEKVVMSKPVQDSIWFLEKYYQKLSFWVITGTPSNEIEIIASRRNMLHFFEGLHGSPENKRHWTEYLIKKHGLNREETLFLGDATTDLDAAQYSKLHFALRDNEENEGMFKDYNGPRFSNFRELEQLLVDKNLL